MGLTWTSGGLLIEPRIITRTSMSAPEVQEFASGEVCVFTTAAPDREGPNEDAAALVQLEDGTGVLAVADGCGGMPAGDEAAHVALHALIDAVLGKEGGNGVLRTAVLDGFESANQAVMELGSGAGTTLAVVTIESGVLRTFHVGDSPILLTGQRGRLKMQTVPHSPTGYGIEAGLLNEKQAVNHEERNLVLNMVGSKEMSIEIGPKVSFAPRDTLLLSSDGLVDNLYQEEIVERVRKGPLLDASTALIEICQRRMHEDVEGQPCHPDDLTVVLFRATPGSKRLRSQGS